MRFPHASRPLHRSPSSLPSFFVYSLLSFAVLQAFLAARLDGTVQWNYWIVLLPWIQWEGVSLLYKLFYAPSEYAHPLPRHPRCPPPPHPRPCRPAQVR